MTLFEKQVTFASLVASLLTQAHVLGYQVKLGECLRTPEQAAIDAAKGSGILHSVHTLSLAIDLLLFRGGDYLEQTEDYLALGEWWEAQSTDDYTCAWGGRFNRKDGDHFSLEHNGIR